MAPWGELALELGSDVEKRVQRVVHREMEQRDQGGKALGTRGMEHRE